MLDHAGQFEDALHFRWPRDHIEGEPVGRGRGAPRDHKAQSGRVEKAHLAEIERKARESEGPQLGQFGLEGQHGCEIELTDGAYIGGSASRLDLTSEWLDL